MAWEKPLESLTLLAAADLSAYQYRAVKVDNTGKAALAGAGENAIGILQNAPLAGEAATVMDLGVSKAIFGGNVAAGANLAADAQGRLVAAGGGDAVIGVAFEGGAIGEIRSVLLVTRTATGVTQPNSVISIPVKLANLQTGDVLTTYTPGFAGTIQKISVAVTDPTTDVDADASINLEIGTTNLTGGVVTLSDANMATLGTVVDGTAITAGNTFSASDSISIEATVTNAFSDGEIVVLIVLG